MENNSEYIKDFITDLFSNLSEEEFNIVVTDECTNSKDIILNIKEMDKLNSDKDILNFFILDTMSSFIEEGNYKRTLALLKECTYKNKITTVEPLYKIEIGYFEELFNSEHDTTNFICWSLPLIKSLAKTNIEDLVRLKIFISRNMWSKSDYDIKTKLDLKGLTDFLIENLGSYSEISDIKNILINKIKTSEQKLAFLEFSMYDSLMEQANKGVKAILQDVLTTGLGRYIVVNSLLEGYSNETSVPIQQLLLTTFEINVRNKVLNYDLSYLYNEEKQRLEEDITKLKKKLPKKIRPQKKEPNKKKSKKIQESIKEEPKKVALEPAIELTLEEIIELLSDDTFLLLKSPEITVNLPSNFMVADITKTSKDTFKQRYTAVIILTPNISHGLAWRVKQFSSSKIIYTSKTNSEKILRQVYNEI